MWNMQIPQLMGLFVIFLFAVFVVFPIVTLSLHFIDLLVSKIFTEKVQDKTVHIPHKIQNPVRKNPVEAVLIHEFIPPEPPVRRKPRKVRSEVPESPINTTSNIKEYRLPDGSRIAIDTDKVEVSEKAAF
jgi:hypothetical protein